MNPTITLCTVLSLAIGGAAGSIITYRVTSQAQASCLSVAPAHENHGIPPSFFRSEPHPTVGGQQY